MSRAITPEEAEGGHAMGIPDAVFKIFNERLSHYRRGTTLVIKQADVLNEVCRVLGVERHHVFARNWLDIEKEYEAAGWRVTYDKPGFNETYDAYWEFQRNVP